MMSQSARGSDRSVDRSLWIAAAVALALSATPWGETVLYPFKLFTTWIHECGHAVVTLLVGGTVSSITIQPDTSGLTMSMLPTGRIAQGLVSSAGYMGASIVGCMLVVATRMPRRATAILLFVGVGMLATAVFWMRNTFGFVVVLGWGAALVVLAKFGTSAIARFVVGLLAVQVALNAVYDIRVLFLVTGAHSDADSMAALFVLPAWFWAGLWMSASVALLGVTLWKTRK
jgi:hypothetical protein